MVHTFQGQPAPLIRDRYRGVLDQIMAQHRIPQREPSPVVPAGASFAEVVQNTDWFCWRNDSPPPYRYRRYREVLGHLTPSGRRGAHVDIGCGAGLFSWVFLGCIVKLLWPTAPRPGSGKSPGTTPPSWHNASPHHANPSTSQSNSPPDGAPDTAPHHTPAETSDYASEVSPAPSHARASPPTLCRCHTPDPPANTPLQSRQSAPPPEYSRPPSPP